MSYGLYVHIPYCHGRCRYCDFYTQAAGEVPNEYIDALLRVFCELAPRREGGAPQRPDTVYFGGGTPSLLSGGQVAKLLEVFNPAQDAEVTLEANPESATEEKLAAWREAGVNRLSVGVQTANAQSLQILGRRHTAQQAREVMRAARRAGFENISGDIMMALPGYSRAEFDETLALLYDEGAAHISAYLLKIEDGTAFGSAPPQNLPDTEEAADFYLYAVEQLAAAGYAQYEISNFAKPGFESRHNLIYWNCGDYLGLGPAAHSCMGNKRFSFAADTDAFIGGQVRLRPEGDCTVEDYIMLRLRLNEGLQEAELERCWGVGLSKKQHNFLQVLVKQGLAHMVPGGLALTPRGMLVQNNILAQLLND